MFAVLPQIYPKDFADFFIRNYFRFLVDVFHKWLIQFNIPDFYKIMNELDPDLQFKSCHPSHTKNNIALSLARRILQIVTDNTNNRLQELEGHLLKRKHLEKNN